ncbi:hypothetical protein FB45DRAFT_39297 [Roridomyces roridus]|uniref:Uncharacterized protein n=1 Tax=Roridomyces roridus TaxID=1738132 RepID=A0AAD7FJX8_9AGAR|nr:hypothetical protein FB45DRAFT_39297 [Roridomyces roridus]
MLRVVPLEQSLMPSVSLTWGRTSSFLTPAPKTKMAKRTESPTLPSTSTASRHGATPVPALPKRPHRRSLPAPGTYDEIDSEDLPRYERAVVWAFNLGIGSCPWLAMHCVYNLHRVPFPENLSASAGGVAHYPWLRWVVDTYLGYNTYPAFPQRTWTAPWTGYRLLMGTPTGTRPSLARRRHQSGKQVDLIPRTEQAAGLGRLCQVHGLRLHRAS